MGKHKNKKNKQLQSEEPISSPSMSPVTSQMTPLSSPAIVPDSPLQVPTVITEENSVIETVVVQVQQATDSDTIKDMIEQAQKEKEQKFLRLLEEQKSLIREVQQDLENLLEVKEQALSDLTKEQELHAQLKDKLEENEISKNISHEEQQEEEQQEKENEEQVKPVVPWYKRMLRFFHF